MYEHAASRRWDAAIEMQKTVARFFAESEAFIVSRGEGAIDPVFDKGLGVAAGCLVGSQRTRPPHLGWSDETVKALREWLQRNYPQLIYRAESG
jgi:hypothetical protein